MRHLVVVGGGIAGLSAAWTAAGRTGDVPGGLQVTVVERESEVGGKARSQREEGWLVERGPATFPDRPGPLANLIAEVGLAGQVQAASPVAAHRYVFHHGRMRRLTANPLSLLTSGLLTPGGMARLLAEPFVPRRRDEADETVWAFAVRRLGLQIAERLVHPMMLGIFAGNAKRLSVAAAFPRMVTAERDHGSLLRAATRSRTGPGRSAPRAFADGMQALPLAMAAAERFQVVRGGCVEAIRPARDGWDVMGSGFRAPMAADTVILAGEAFAMAPLLRPLAPPAAAALEAIPYPPVAVVTMGFPETADRHIPRGFGILVARGEGYHMLGTAWDSRVFPGRAPVGKILVRALYGGAVCPDIATQSEPELIALARNECRRMYGTSAPDFTRVTRWARAIPQFEVGHPDRVAQVERALSTLPGLFAAGSALYGIAFPDAAASGVRAGNRAVDWLRAR